MEAQISRVGEITVVHLSGKLNFETSEPFRKNFLARLKSEKVIFDLKDLSFVGSSGITLFLDALSEYCLRHTQSTKFSNVSSEFRKIFAASPLSQWEFYTNAQLAAHSFTNPVLQKETFSSFQDETSWVEDEEE